MLTEPQHKVYNAILSLSVRNRYAPSYREIAAKVGLRSQSVIHKHVRALIRKGWLVRVGAREIEIVPPKQRNGLEWRSCDSGHARCFFQVPTCPACIFARQLIAKAAGGGLLLGGGEFKNEGDY